MSVVPVKKRQSVIALVVNLGEMVIFIAGTSVCRVRWVSYVYNKYCCVCVFRLYLSLSSLVLCSLMFWNTIPWFINNLNEQYMFDTILVGCFLASSPGLTVSSSGSSGVLSTCTTAGLLLNASPQNLKERQMIR